jgi:hypothetical protein
VYSGEFQDCKYLWQKECWRLQNAHQFFDLIQTFCL